MVVNIIKSISLKIRADVAIKMTIQTSCKLLLPERDYVTFGYLPSQFRLSVCRLSSICLYVRAPYSAG